MKVRTPIKLLFTIVITLILNGCYEDYLFIQSKLENGKINQDSEFKNKRKLWKSMNSLFPVKTSKYAFAFRIFP